MPVLIDVKAVSRAATRKDLEAIRRPEDLPPGASLIADIETTLLIRAPIRWSWQMHWVREAAAGVLAGVVRHPGGRLSRSAGRRGLGRGVPRGGHKGGRPAAAANVPRDVDLLQSRRDAARQAARYGGRSLAGDYRQASSGCCSGLLAQMGGQRWLDAAAAAGIPTCALEDLTSRWQRLGPQEQAALFRAAGQSDWLQLIREWSREDRQRSEGSGGFAPGGERVAVARG